jgi:hypothetical protein
MKQILTYIDPNNKDFNAEHKMAVKIQIDNSLSLGWKPGDIILATNFPYEYNGIKSIVIDDENYCTHNWPATKIYVIVYLFKVGLIRKGMYWYHDFDCFQLAPFAETEPELGLADLGLTNYGRMPRLCSASIFFKETARDIFEQLKKRVDEDRINEEVGIMRLINANADNIKDRIKLLNLTYALHRGNFHHCYARAIKPIKATHFHLTSDKYDFFVKGKNKVNLVIIPERLIKIFHQHGFTG